MSAAAKQKISKVSRWGNSLGFRIPQEGVELLQLRDGEAVVVRYKGDSIVIRRAKVRRRFTEKELLKGISPAMCGTDLLPDRRGRELI